MLAFSLFLAGFTLGIFTALKVFSPERHEDIWDPQHFPSTFRENKTQVESYKGFLQHLKKNDFYQKSPG